MLLFFDESFRQARSGHRFGVLYGIGIPEENFGTVIADRCQKWQKESQEGQKAQDEAESQENK